MLTRYGTDNIIVMLVISLVLLLAGYFVTNKWVSIPFYSAGILLAVFTLWFFRDPDRNIPDIAKADHSIILAPADGKIVNVLEEEEKYFLKGPSKRVSIFLSPVDVHVNRSPVTGTVEYYEYFPGDYLVAYHPKSSELNEHTRIGVETNCGKVFFKQIVGILARRLVCELKVGDSVEAGRRFGMMKFGSRMDIAISPDSEIYVKEGDRVVAGETIIAKLKCDIE